MTNYVQADAAGKAEIAEKVKYYVLGQMYYLANDDEVPEYTRNDASSYGLCNDEWVYINIESINKIINSFYLL